MELVLTGVEQASTDMELVLTGAFKTSWEVKYPNKGLPPMRSLPRDWGFNKACEPSTNSPGKSLNDVVGTVNNGAVKK
ncbi:hypothetical protein Trydic_g3077 [Trypoxylus dichotomus]